MAKGYDTTSYMVEVPVMGMGIPDSRAELRAYLVRYALWAVCGEGPEPETPPCLRDK